MLVRNWMTTKVVTIDADASMEKAIKAMKQNDVRMLPVLRQERLVGVVTDRDLKRASASEATTLEVHELFYLISKIKVATIMSAPAISVPPDLTVEETAEVLLRHHISGAPVVEADGRIVGLITQSEINKLIIALTGLGQRGVQFAFILADLPGSIKNVADMIRGHNGRLLSILTSYDRVPEGYRKVYIRCYGIDRARMPSLVDTLREKFQLLYMVDHRDNRREIFAA